MTHDETLKHFETMVNNFGSFSLTADAAKSLLASIKDLQANNANLITLNRVLRHRPDTTLEVSLFHNEMERLLNIERGLLHEPRNEFHGLTEHQVRLMRQMGSAKNSEDFDSLCGLALERMETYRDPRGVTWVSPTAYAYAQTCGALHQLKAKAEESEGFKRAVLEKLEGITGRIEEIERNSK